MKYKLYFSKDKKNKKQRKLVFESNDFGKVVYMLLKYDDFNYECYKMSKFFSKVYFCKCLEFHTDYYIIVNDNENNLYDITNYYLLFEEEKK